MILLTGGTGFVGRHLVTQCAAEQRPVRVLSRSAAPAVLPPTIAWQRGDLTDADSLRAALAGAHTVIHAAATLAATADGLDALHRTNVEGTAGLARRARDAGVQHFIHVGSAGVYGDGDSSEPFRESDAPRPGDAYERSKLDAEQALIAALEGSSVRWTILRPPGLYGGDREATAAFFRTVASRRVWWHGPARVVVHPTHISDLVRAVLAVVDRPGLGGEIVNVGGARPLTFQELIAMVGERMGSGPRQFTAPSWTADVAHAMLRVFGFAGATPGMVRRLARRTVNRSVSIDKAQRLLAFEPVPLAWGLDETAAEVRRAARN